MLEDGTSEGEKDWLMITSLESNHSSPKAFGVKNDIALQALQDFSIDRQTELTSGS